MKKILFFMFVALALTFVSCGDDDYAVDEAYEKAEITNVTVYNRAEGVMSIRLRLTLKLGLSRLL